MIRLNQYDPRPIYEQVKETLKKQIVTGILKPGDQLPSVRDLATQLVINPNTIQRAYRELESEGYIYKQTGKGTFVAEQKHIPAAQEQKLLAAFRESVANLLYCGYDADRLIDTIRTMEKEVSYDD